MFFLRLYILHDQWYRKIQRVCIFHPEQKYSHSTIENEVIELNRFYINASFVNRQTELIYKSALTRAKLRVKASSHLVFDWEQ